MPVLIGSKMAVSFRPRTLLGLTTTVELIGFPGTKQDDQVDSTTQALDYLREPNVIETMIKAFT
jgi:hypothetical protein